MNKLYTLFTFCLLFSASALFAQKEVNLSINHKMGNDVFALNTETTTPDAEDIKFTRLEYYLSHIILIHDGGQATPVANTWILVNGVNGVNINLGSFAIDSLEQIRFGVGVEADVNHLDPSTYAPSHPLAPKSPSMHWGWAAGYRFVALEGRSGTAFDQVVEFHALGDGNYFQTIIPTNGTNTDTSISIELNADYTQAVKGISVVNGVILHGEDMEAIDLMHNFNLNVFTSSEGNAALVSLNKPTLASAKLYPNPSIGNATLAFEEGALPNAIHVYDLQGRLILSINQPTNSTTLTNVEPGVYTIACDYGNDGRQSIKWVVTR